ncbi:hypothetical protein BT63DRAFT_146678 [Microthyrium microscopicum]|uniref:Uncharacterized protein n=1 Tax=Microthyrium microscopicum TaxID=703497 RepID=A0A6A6UNS0_9PEZI|nr:hypothetical protein BT63DRAFT_146678 [Microthyrium microscopicum]
MHKSLAPLEHEIVGTLDGLNLDTSISHGFIVATSARRIAVATWDRIQLYSIEPEAFLTAKEGSLEWNDDWKKKSVKRKTFQFLNFSCEYGEKDDHTYSVNCGQGYYRQYTRLFHRRIVSLKPIELPPRGVVHKLHFTDDDMLWAWTDRGLVKWFWGPGRSALRVEKELSPGVKEFDGPVGKGKAPATEVDDADKMDWEA